ncbi:MAG TPA: DUF4346 domain-containing protein [Methanocorpusculum sp.]|nr:DUF4346 domain-containing protein [Methanocorpusculum sp.]
MRVLFPTGTQSAAVLERELQTAEGFEWDVVAAGEVASFLTISRLRSLIADHPADCVVVSGMCTADFSAVEKETGIPIYRGTRHAADIRRCFSLIVAGTLSRTQAADTLLENQIRKETAERLLQNEQHADAYCTLRDTKFGGTSRIKVLCEIMDAHRRTDLRETACRALAAGADGIDLGFGFDAEPADVIRCFQELENLPCVLSIDTLNPDLIKASLFRVDIVISLTYDTLDELADDIRAAETAVVLIPRDEHPLPETIAKAQDLGLAVLFADPLLQPPLSGMTATFAEFLLDYGIPKFMGCVNVTELIDADSPGICAMLAATATECGCAFVLVSEHSDKTQGAVSEMRRAVDLMQSSAGRPYPKDVGCDVFVIKEKRKRREPVPLYDTVVDVSGVPENPVFDPNGNFRIGVEDGKIVAVRHGKAIRGKTAEEVFAAILAENGVSLLDHAAYLGRELYKAELAIRFGRSFEQDGSF